MIKKYFISALLASTVSILYADDAPMFSLPGGNVMPINNEDIRLVSETIDFYLYPDHIGYDVEINYNFYNEGETQEIQLGFPTDSIREIYSNFVCTVNGKEVKVERKAGQWTFLQNVQNEFKDYGGYLPYFGGYLPYFYDSDDKLHYGGNAFDVFTATFKSNDTTKIKNTYHSEYECNKDCEDMFFWYILETGRYWKGKIDEVRVRVNTDYYPQGFNYAIDVHSFDDYEKVYKDIEPDFNLIFTLHPSRHNHMPKASSTLVQTGIFSYNIENIVDKDPTTAWIEGEDGYGEGSTIEFDFEVSQGNWCCEPLSDIREIHIINGYAKDPKTFKNNSRVKDIEIVSTEELFNKKQDISKYSDIYKDDEFNSISGKRKYNFTLKDTMEPQILKFDSPKDLYKMKIIIKSVYPGAKYKDTAISEISFR